MLFDRRRRHNIQFIFFFFLKIHFNFNEYNHVLLHCIKLRMVVVNFTQTIIVS